MFICGGCHYRSGCGKCVVPTSHGACELCHKVDICFDCQSDKTRGTKPTHPDWYTPEVRACEQRCARCSQLMTLQPNTGKPLCPFCGMGTA